MSGTADLGYSAVSLEDPGRPSTRQITESQITAAAPPKQAQRGRRRKIPIAGDVERERYVDKVLEDPAGGLANVLADCVSGGPPCSLLG